MEENISAADVLFSSENGSGAYTFQFRPHSEIDIIWTHYNGQVEIDGLLAGERKGKTHLFVIEAKASKKYDSLAKHKLFYPVLSVSRKVPENIPIIPVYLRVIKRKDGIHFFIAECHEIDLKNPILSSLQVKNISHYVILGLE